MKQINEKPDRQCIRMFAAFLNTIGRPVSGVDCWPEDKAPGEIDAIAGPYAIQHTSIDALLNKREVDLWFNSVIDGLEDEFRNKLGFRLSIIFHWASIKKGQKKAILNNTLRDWISREAPLLPEGHHQIDNIPNLPFAFDVTKGGPLKTDGVVFVRYDPSDQTLSARLKDQIAGRHDKLTVLGLYREQGKTALLLLEAKHSTLMSDRKLVEAFEEAFPAWPDTLDELWFIDHVDPPRINVHDLRLGRTWIFDTETNTTISNNDNTSRVWSDARPDQLFG